jgi:hypothetical protein
LAPTTRTRISTPFRRLANAPDQTRARRLSTGSDIGRVAIAKIEGGTRCVGDIELLELAKALSCPMGALFPARAQAVIGGRK